MSAQSKAQNRKGTKVDYLYQEIAQLKEHVETLEYQLQLNKAQLKIALQPTVDNQTSQDNYSGPQVKNNNTKNINDINSVKSLQLMIESTRKENDFLQNRVKQVLEERDQAQGKNLIMEQMYENAEKQRKETIEDLKNNTMRLQNKLKEAELRLQQLEKNHLEIDQLSGIVLQYRDIVPLNQQSEILHIEIQKQNTYIQSQAREIVHLREQKDNLLLLNAQLNKQIINQKEEIQNLRQQRGKKNKRQLSEQYYPQQSRNFIQEQSPLNSNKQNSQNSFSNRDLKLNLQKLNQNFPEYQDPEYQDIVQNSQDKDFEQALKQDVHLIYQDNPQQQQIQQNSFQQNQDDIQQLNELQQCNENPQQLQANQYQENFQQNSLQYNENQQNQNQQYIEQNPHSNQEQQQNQNQIINFNQNNQIDENNDSFDSDDFDYPYLEDKVQGKQKPVNFDLIKQRQDQLQREEQDQNIQSQVEQQKINLNIGLQPNIQQLQHQQYQNQNQVQNQEQYQQEQQIEQDNYQQQQQLQKNINININEQNKDFNEFQQNQNQDLNEEQQYQQQEQQVQQNDDIENHEIQNQNNPQNKKYYKDLIALHKQFQNNDDDESDKASDEDYEEERLPDKVHYIHTQQGEEQKGGRLQKLIPQLDLSKPMMIAQKTVDKQMKQEASKYIQQNGFNLQPYIDKINRQDQRLERAGKNIAKELLKNKNLEAENERLQKENKELESQNETIIKAYQQNEEKWQKQQKQYLILDEFYRKYNGSVQLNSGERSNKFSQIDESYNQNFNFSDKASTTAERTFNKAFLQNNNY